MGNRKKERIFSYVVRDQAIKGRVFRKTIAVVSMIVEAANPSERGVDDAVETRSAFGDSKFAGDVVRKSR